MALQKRTVSFDIVYDDELVLDPIDWDYFDLLDISIETLRNLIVVPSLLTEADRQAYEEENRELFDEDD